MACKNNKKNRRRAAFYRINKFDYEVRENLAKGHPLPVEAPIEKDKEFEYSLGNAWTKAWKPKITVVQTISQKA